MRIPLTENDAQEVLHKLTILAANEDALEDYELPPNQAEALLALIPRKGGLFVVPPEAQAAVREEMEDHVTILRDQASDARKANEKGLALRIDKQADRLERLFT